MIPEVYAQATKIGSKGIETAEQSKTAVSELLSVLWDKIDNWFAALVVFGVSLILANTFRKMVIERISRHLDEEHQDILILSGRATYVTVMGLGLTIGLKVAGIDITAIVAAIGFGIGFAMKDLIMNFIAGVILMITRNYTIGDFIKVGDAFGKITEIQGRATILKALDGTKIIVPNSDLFSNRVISYTSNPFRRLDVMTYVDYSTNLRKAIQILMNVMKSDEHILKEPEPVVLIKEWGDSNINLLMRFWVDSKSKWWTISSNLRLAVNESFEKTGISMSFPARTMYWGENDEQKIDTQAHGNDAENNAVFDERLETDEEKEKKAYELAKKTMNKNLVGNPLTATSAIPAPVEEVTDNEPPVPMGVINPNEKNPDAQNLH
ncbi:mechanosensitive ion channel family protein [Candidatus Peregrinibacteria bacterium]|nr:mechanosensitive ion channel family protein [Candidatus Peregrinibacteria bacterium]